MLALSVEADVGLERGVRALAADHEPVAALVRAADDRHELILTTDLAAVYGLKGEEAQEFGRVLHALHVAAMSRPADGGEDLGRRTGTRDHRLAGLELPYRISSRRKPLSKSCFSSSATSVADHVGRLQGRRILAGKGALAHLRGGGARDRRSRRGCR